MSAHIQEAVTLVANHLGVDRHRICVERLSHSVDDRAVLRLTVGRRSVVAKLYPDDLGSRCARSMRALAQTAEAPLVLPEALLWSAQVGLLLMSDMVGTSYRRLAHAAATDVAARQAMRRAGAALARLHACPVPDGSESPATMADHTRQLIRPCPTALADRRPDLASRVLAVQAAVIAAEPVHPVVPIHRDLHLGQLVDVGSGCVGVLDWDLQATGDAALDLGNLLAYLDSRLGPAGRGAADAVLAGYQDVAGGEVPSRTAPYEALAYLRMTAKRARLGPVTGGPLSEHEALRRAEARCA